MRFRPLLLCLLLIFTIQLAKANASKKDPNDLEFSHEDSENSEEYFNGHDEYSNEVHEKRKEVNIEEHTVCQKNKADRCACDKSGRIDCRKETRERNANGISVATFTTSAIKLSKDADFTPKYVYLTGNQIEIITQATLLPGMQDTVEGLDLSYNDIEFIGEGAFDKMKKLRKLRLNQNFIAINESLDGWITDALGEHLEVLNLAYNSITTVPDGVFNSLHNLKKLILDGNAGLVLNDNTFNINSNFTQLDSLSLDKCGLKDLSANFFKFLPKLKYLSLIDNQFTSLPASLKAIPNLNTLDFSENKDMVKWPKDAMKDYSNLETLFLRGMKFSSYDDCSFCGLTKLKFIDFSGSSKLKSFDKNAFGYDKNLPEATEVLKTFKVEDCNLATLEEGLLRWEKVEEMWAGGNPWKCNSDLGWLTTSKKIHLSGTKIAKCAEPKSMENTTLSELQKQVAQPQTTSGFTHFLYTLFYIGISIGFIGLLLTVVLVVTKRYDTRNVLNSMFSRQQPSGAGGFSNINSEGADNERVFEDDDEEFHPRPAAV